MSSPSASPVALTLLPIVAAIFTAYLVIGVAMPVLPLHVHQDLGFGTFVVGLVAGSQFTVSLISRFWAGRQADTRGAKRSVVLGLIAAAVAGALYLLSLRLVSAPVASVTVLLIGRGVLGGAESFIVAGGLTWGFALVGVHNAGKVMAWVGSAMYVAYAIGAPTGTALYAGYGFTAIALATGLIPMLAYLVVRPIAAVAAAARTSPAFTQVAAAVWLPGMGMALSSVGFGAITTFVTLLFAERGWSQAWICLTSLSVMFLVSRLLFGHLPDRIGGPKVALVSVLIEAAGVALIWLAASPGMVFAGGAVAGLGYSMVYPGFGVEAVRRAPPESKGLAMGAYTAFLDLALGLANPALGLVAGKAGLNAVYLVSSVVVVCAAVVAVRLMAEGSALSRNKDVVRHGIPGIVDADEKKQ